MTLQSLLALVLGLGLGLLLSLLMDERTAKIGGIILVVIGVVALLLSLVPSRRRVG